MLSMDELTRMGPIAGAVLEDAPDMMLAVEDGLPARYSVTAGLVAIRIRRRDFTACMDAEVPVGAPHRVVVDSVHAAIRRLRGPGEGFLR